MKMKYTLEGVHAEAVARFGVVETLAGSYDMPAAAPAVRTRADVLGLQQAMHAGFAVRVVTPYASCRKTLAPVLRPILSPENKPNTVKFPRPLVVADPESEALSFNCNARIHYQSLGHATGLVGRLLNTALSDKGEHTTEVHATWADAERRTKLDALMAWNANNLRAVGSDVNLVVTPIIRDDISTVRDALNIGKTYVAPQLHIQHMEFPLRGIHFLIHGELFRPTHNAEKARMTFLNDVRTWHADSKLQGIVLSIKLHDNLNILHDPQDGSASRRAFSEFIQGLQEAMAMAGGLLVVHNMGNWVLGVLDAGADIATFRVSGHAKIDTPIRNTRPKKGKRQVPPLMMARSLTTRSWTDLKADLERDGSYPLPSFMHEAEAYGDMKYSEAQTYAAKVNIGVMVDVADYYRNAGRDPHIQLRDALMDQTNDSRLRQELRDLCPSLME